MRNGPYQTPDRPARGTHDWSNRGYEAVSVREAGAEPGWVSGQLEGRQRGSTRQQSRQAVGVSEVPYVDGPTAVRACGGGGLGVGSWQAHAVSSSRERKS